MRATLGLVLSLLSPDSKCANATSGGFFKKGLLLIVACAMLFGGCHSRQGNNSSGVSIEFTRIPPAEVTRTDKLDLIQGKVSGAQPGQQIVLYARIGNWRLQPLSNFPFTEIHNDSTWINMIHLGSEYAALLVGPDYRPQAMLDTLPAPGGAVAAVATIQGVDAASVTPQPIQFSGYEWRVRNAASRRGNRFNPYDPSNAWIDQGGALHLRISKQGNQWTCAEVTLTRSFGYGTYSFVVRDTSHLEPAMIFGMYTWDYAEGDQNNREMDIEIGRWGDPASKNAQYVIQPFYIAANVARFMAPAAQLTYSFHWEPGKVTFRTARGADVISEQVFTSGIPAPGTESVRMALYIYSNVEDTADPVQNNAEVVVDKFEYLP
jgi:hypothetical protein